MPRSTVLLVTSLVLAACGEAHTDPTGDLETTTGTAADPTTEPSTDPTEVDPGTTDAETTAPPTSEPTTAETSAETSAETTDEPGTTTTTTATTTDPTGGTADCGFDPSLVFDRFATTWQLISDDGETCVLLTRRDDSEPDVIYKAVPYTLLTFKIGHAGALTEYTDLATLHWESTHHNWLDVAEAWDTSVRYRLADRYGQDFIDSFDLGAIDEQTKTPLWGPIVVHPYTP